MKTIQTSLTIILLLGLLSCENKILNVKNTTYNEFLSDKAIISIGLFNNHCWVYSAKMCDTCYVAPYMSYRPMVSQLTMISDSSFEYDEPTLVAGPTMDHQSNLYTASQNKIFKLNGIKDYQLFFDANDFNFYNYAFDKEDNIWFAGYNGLGFWNHQEFKIYNTSNSELPSNIIHGLAIDKDNNVWVTLDFKGLLKINGDKWEIIPNTDIPGLKTTSYLSNPIVDNENNIWFYVLDSNIASNILKFDGQNWNYQYPNQNGYGIINKDSKGILWVIHDEFENYTFKKSTLAYRQNNEWINLDVSRIKFKITTVNSDGTKIYIGTVGGLNIIDK